MTTIDDVPADVRDAFEQKALEVYRAGYRRYSARTICHRLRWHFHIEKGDREFKFNNNWTPALARWLMEKHPHMEGFFETRRAAA